MKAARLARPGAGLVLALAGCATSDPSPDAPPPPARPGPTTDTASKPPPSEEAIVVKGIPLAHWEDPTTGPVATLLYVSEKRDTPDGPRKPAVIISSSDPRNPHFERRNTAVLTVQRTTKEELGALLLELRQDGLDQLAWEDQPYDAEIGPERALYMYRDGKRQVVRKASLSDEHRAVFTAIEKRLIAHAQRFVEAGQR